MKYYAMPEDEKFERFNADYADEMERLHKLERAGTAKEIREVVEKRGKAICFQNLTAKEKEGFDAILGSDTWMDKALDDYNLYIQGLFYKVLSAAEEAETSATEKNRIFDLKQQVCNDLIASQYEDDGREPWEQGETEEA